MFGNSYVSAGLGALLFALVISLIFVAILFAVLGWLAKKRGL